MSATQGAVSRNFLISHFIFVFTLVLLNYFKDICFVDPHFFSYRPVARVDHKRFLPFGYDSLLLSLHVISIYECLPFVNRRLPENCESCPQALDKSPKICYYVDNLISCQLLQNGPF
jgi:hypothetical protein